MGEEVVQAAMSIILNAGDARVLCQEALKALADFDIDTAKDKLKEANTKIVSAHKVQTDAIQGETRGEKKEYSLLFAHAQDTLMTIYSELTIAKQLINLTASIDNRIKHLESEE